MSNYWESKIRDKMGELEISHPIRTNGDIYYHALRLSDLLQSWMYDEVGIYNNNIQKTIDMVIEEKYCDSGYDFYSSYSKYLPAAT